VQQRQLKAKMAAIRHKIFCVREFTKPTLHSSVHFVFVSTFNLKQGRTFVVGIANLSK